MKSNNNKERKMQFLPPFFAAKEGKAGQEAQTKGLEESGLQIVGWGQIMRTAAVLAQTRAESDRYQKHIFHHNHHTQRNK